MYRSILVPLDGSPFAEEALPLALKIANLAGADLEIMHVHQVYGVGDSYYSWSPYNRAVDDMVKEKERTYLDMTAERLGKAASIPVTSALVDALIADGILERVRSKPVDLIVMTTHGRGPMSRFWLGSVADELVRHSSAPILLVRPYGTSTISASELSLKQILIPLDESALAERVLEPTIALGSLWDADYTLVRSILPALPPECHPLPVEPAEIDQSVVERPRAVAQAYLDAVAERLRSKAQRIQTRVVVGNSPATAILELACRQSIDLVAIATHGHGGLKRLLLGSVTDKIVRGSTMPVLIYRPSLVRCAAIEPTRKSALGSE